MKDIRIISGKRIVPSMETVTALMGAKNTGAAESRIKTIYEKLLPAVQMRVRAKAALVIDELRLSADENTETYEHAEEPESKVLYVMLTIGDGISRLAEKFTAGNEMLKAMIADAMADSCLFAFEEQLLPYIRQFCLEEGYGITGRIEIMRDVPAAVQKTVFEALEAERTLGLSITSGYMLKPEKSMSLLFALTEDVSVQCLEHNCGTCANQSCMLKKEQETVVITIEQISLHPFTDSPGNFLITEENSLAGGVENSAKEKISCPEGNKLLDVLQENSTKIRVSCQKGSKLLDVLHENGIMISAYCGGKGTCGKCGVLLKEGHLPITPEDKIAFSEKELQQGMRLSCMAILQENITVTVWPQQQAIFQTPDLKENSGQTAEKNGTSQNKTDSSLSAETNHYGIAIDIGTTTLAFALTRLPAGTIVDTYTAVNTQRAFGADVLTRMQAANAGKGQQLCRCIRQDILNGIHILLNRNAVKPSALKDIVIAANTVMLHLLRGYSCEGLSRYPFTPVTLDTEALTLSQLYADFPEEELEFLAPERINVTLLPGISAFVGADITAGIYACDIPEKKAAVLFLDLGTNGEMVLKKGNTIYTASTAAGPAFEAGNIKWGMPGIAGAISQVAIKGTRPTVQTIADCPPQGICGTGVIEAIAELYAAGLIDTTGKLQEPYFPGGYPLAETVQGEQIMLYQQDIREIQMAKAAIRAGIEILMQRSGIHPEEIELVFLAGGFGYFLDIKKAAAIGILPENLLTKTKSVGNTSLKGAQLYLTRQNHTALTEIKKSAREISLAQDEHFQELYLKYMSFEASAKILLF